MKKKIGAWLCKHGIHRKRFSNGSVASAVICTHCKKIITPAITWPTSD
jgi:hypothetical protein